MRLLPAVASAALCLALVGCSSSDDNDNSSAVVNATATASTDSAPSADAPAAPAASATAPAAAPTKLPELGKNVSSQELYDALGRSSVQSIPEVKSYKIQGNALVLEAPRLRNADVAKTCQIIALVATAAEAKPDTRVVVETGNGRTNCDLTKTLQ